MQNTQAGAITSPIDVLAPDPPFWNKTSLIQLGYGIWVNMTIMGIGLSFGFPAIAIPQLKDEMSGIQISLSQEAWIASILTLSAPVGNLISGILMDRYGRKIVLVLCAIPLCVGWFYTGFAVSAKHIIVGRVIAGVGLGMAVTAPRAYVTEITLPNMRGVIGALPNLFMSLGLTILAGLGSFLTWYMICYIGGCYTLITMLANIFLPETPYFLLLKASRDSSAAKVNLKKFRSSKYNVDAELEALREFRNENNIRSLSIKDQVKALFKPSSCKPFGITTVFLVFMQLSGVNVVTMWAVEMLDTAKSSINPNIGNLSLAITRVAFGLLTSVLFFKVGRRVMALISATGVGVVALSLCLFLHLNVEKSVLPQLLFMAYIGFATLGYYTLPLLMMFEMLPLQLRGLLSGICFSQVNLLIFGMNKLYPLVRNKLGLANTMAMFGCFSLLGAVILYFILPETKGLTLQEIEEYFNTRRPTLVSQRRVMSDQLFDTSRMIRNEKENKHLDTKTKTNRDLKMKANELKIKEKALKENANLKDDKKELKIKDVKVKEEKESKNTGKDWKDLTPTSSKDIKDDAINSHSKVSNVVFKSTDNQKESADNENESKGKEKDEKKDLNDEEKDLNVIKPTGSKDVEDPKNNRYKDNQVIFKDTAD